MISLQNKLRQLYEPFTELNCEVFHHIRQCIRMPEVVWSEDGEDNSFDANNRKQEQQLTGVIDLYTKKEFDPLADDIQTILYDQGIGWRLNTVQYEPETNIIHFSWTWWVV